VLPVMKTIAIANSCPVPASAPPSKAQGECNMLD
jgi:hypothetical protein